MNEKIIIKQHSSNAAEPTGAQRRHGVWPNARFGTISLTFLLLGVVTFIGMIFAVMLIPSLAPSPTVYVNLLFGVPALLAFAGSATGLSGIVLDPRKMLALLTGSLNIAALFALMEIYPFAFMDH